VTPGGAVAIMPPRNPAGCSALPRHPQRVARTVASGPLPYTYPPTRVPPVRTVPRAGHTTPADQTAVPSPAPHGRAGFWQSRSDYWQTGRVAIGDTPAEVARQPEWDFFVSYTQADRPWAEWIAWMLEDDGYRVLIQAWDFVPGSNWLGNMHDGVQRAARTVAVLSGAYLRSIYGAAEWQAAWARDPAGATRKLLVARVEDCDRPGLLNQVVSLDLFGLPQPQARTVLLDAARLAVGGGRAKPTTAPPFPPSATS
jgi:hypothetical protein